MKIEPHNSRPDFFTRLSIALEGPQSFNPEDFSEIQDEDHPVQVKRIGFLGDLPDWVNPEFYVSYSTAKKLESL